MEASHWLSSFFTEENWVSWHPYKKGSADFEKYHSSNTAESDWRADAEERYLLERSWTNNKARSSKSTRRSPLPKKLP